MRHTKLAYSESTKEMYDPKGTFSARLTASGLYCDGELSERRYAEYPLDVEVALCKEWIEANAKPRKTANYGASSYGLKHVVEQEIDDYIANGAFILAAIKCGYDVYSDELSPNVYFNMSFKEAKG